MSPAPESYDDKPREDYPDREQDSRPSGSSRRKSRSPSPQRHRSSRDDRSRSPAGRRSRSPRRASSRSRSPSPRRMDTDRRDPRDSRDGGAPYDPAAKAANREAVANEAAKRSKKDCRVYVGNLSFSVKWNDLKDFMKEAGTVVFAEIMMLPNGMSKGCGVVEFSSPDEAQKSIRELNDHTLLGRPLFIREDREEEARYGAASVSGRAGYVGPGAFAGPPGGRGGYQGRGGFGGGFQPHGFGGNFGHQGGAPPGQGRHLFIKGLPPTVGWQDLKDLFRAAGNVIRADTKIGPDGNPTGMGTAVFESTQEAQNAIAMYNGFEFQGNLLEVKEDRFAGGFGGGRGGFGGFQPRGGFQGGFQQRGGFQGGFNAGRSFGQDVYADYSGPNAGGAGGDPNAGGFQQQQGGFHQGGGYQGRGGFGGAAPFAPRGFNASYAGSVPGVGVPPSTQIFVKNLPWSTSNEDLIELFQTTGKVQEAEVLFENGRSKGAGVVQFASTEEAENAIAKFQSYSYGGRPLSLEFNGRFKQFGGGDGSAAKMEE